MIPNFPQNPIKIRKLAINYSGWWFIEPTPLKNDGQNVSWDDYSIPNWMESHKNVPVTTNQITIIFPVRCWFIAYENHY